MSTGGESRRTLRKVVVVFKTHFDLGFTDLPEQVMEHYAGPIFSAVQQVMEATAAEPPQLRYNWTLPAWPLKEFLYNTALPEETRASARRLVEEGRLFWHAYPFTTHTVFCGLEDLVRGIQISRSLSEEFGKWPVGAKQTDVPGHTWILPSLLVRAGVKFLHLGCNPGSHSPHVPRLFWWEGPDGSRLLTYYSAGGYGTSPLPPPEWELDTWLALQQTQDNAGPQSPEQLRRIRTTIEEGAPGAEIVFGQLGDFAESLLERAEQLAGLPVVPYDLADTWIHGIGTMPREVAKAREQRANLLALEETAARLDWPHHHEWDTTQQHGKQLDFPLSRQIAPLVDEAYEQLLLFSEHTWGLDVKSTIRRSYGEEFAQARKSEPYARLEASWVAKQQYVTRASEAIRSATNIVLGALQAVDSVSKPQHTQAAPMPVSPANVGVENVLESKWLRVEVDQAAGGIVSLFDKRTGREWVDPSSSEPFGGYRYDLYSARDIAEFMRAYGLLFQDWFVQDFGKQGYPEDMEHITAYARDFKLRKEEAEHPSYTLYLEGGHVEHKDIGDKAVPNQQLSIEIRLTEQHPYLELHYRVTKAATPLAESAVVPFPLNLPKPTFRLGQVGSVIDPARDIVAGANHSLWCADWLDVSDDRVGMAVIFHDMPLVSVGNIGIFTFQPERAPAEPLVYAHLFNTQWGTNFPQWLEGDFDFSVSLYPHVGNWRPGQVWKVAQEKVRYPLRLERPYTSESSRLSPLPITAPDGLKLLAARPRHDGHGLVVRYWDVLGLPRTETLSMDGAVAALRLCDLMERPIAQLKLARRGGYATAELDIKPHAVETLLIEFTPTVGKS
ncbi:MAG: DUF5054 domain-containing protein [Chloroflexi bacterium]|nr:DUF5054 domain-containing protein [Chloroflexota bacterium]